MPKDGSKSTCQCLLFGTGSTGHAVSKILLRILGIQPILIQTDSTNVCFEALAKKYARRGNPRKSPLIWSPSVLEII